MLLIGGGKLITRDSAKPFIEDGAVLCDGRLIKEVGKTSDIASTAWFLCNNDFINGENITVDGGMTKLMIYHNDEGWKLDI